MTKAVLALVALALAWPAFADDPGRCLVKSARQQIGVTLFYDSAYRRIAYPNGDVPADRGVCTDVVIRAYRDRGIDLQQLVHEDMKASWEKYPKTWGLKQPDTNIDHRRVPNLGVFFKGHGQSIAVNRQVDTYLPGDVVTWRLASGVPHVGIVSDKKSAAGTPLMIHNIGGGTQEEDALFSFDITGHYRYLPPALVQACR